MRNTVAGRVVPGVASAAVLVTLALVAAARPAGAEGLDIEWVSVADPGNPSDATTGRGSVAEVFEISKHEVTRGQYAAFLSAVAATDPHGL